jgi:colanic acid biosynthesis glycosyl transferase WcaI
LSDQSILIVTRHYAPEPTGSAPVMAEMAEWLARSGRKVEVLTVRPSYPARSITRGYELGQHDNAVEKGVEVRRLATVPPSSDQLLARTWPELRFLLDLLLGRLTGRIAPRADVVSLCPSILTVAGALFLVKRGGKHVAVVHDIPSGLGAALGLGETSVATRMIRVVESLVLNRVDHVVTLSESMAGQLRGMGIARPITVLPPHVDTEHIRPLPRPRNAPPTVMYSGNLGRKQGLDQLVDLARVLQTRAPQVRVLIKGDGAGKTPLLARLTEEKLSNVQLEPLAPVEQLAESLAEGDVHVVPQLAAGADFALPSKIFAIMAAGRPLVATASSGSPLERLATESGAFICAPLDDAEAFATAVLALLDDPARCKAIGKTARAYVEANASTDVCMSRMSAVLTGASA